MANIISHNKVNNINGSRKLSPMLIAAIVTISGAASMLTGCGSVAVQTSPIPTVQTAIVSETTTFAESVKTESNLISESAVDNSQINQMSAKPEDKNNTETYVAKAETSNDTDPDHVGVDKATAIANVKEQVGSGDEILSCTKGKAPDTGFNCWVVEVAPVTNGNGPEKVTYYSGYQFCYTLDNKLDTSANSTQNPMMNFIGTYTNGRAMMTVSCIGKDQASISISWGSSACETTIWNMSGAVTASNEKVSVSFDNCTKQTFMYDVNGQLLSDLIDYEHGSGSIDFLSSDYNAYWHDAQEGAGDGFSFWYCS